MKVLRNTVIVFAALALIGSAGYLYALNGVKSNAGYADISSSWLEPRGAMLAVTLGPGAVKPFTWLFEQAVGQSEYSDDIPERVLAKALNELKGVQLRVYDADGNRDVFDSAIAETAAALKQKQWRVLISVRDDEDQIVVLQYGDDQQIAGLSIMASTPEKALFLNLIGPFDVDAITTTASNDAF